MSALGTRQWVIPEGYIPEKGAGSGPEMTSHETACILNTSDETAKIQIVVFFADRDPVGPYRIEVPPRRTLRLRFNELEHPKPIPRGTDYASVIRSSVPIVVQHTRFDSRQLPDRHGACTCRLHSDRSPNALRAAPIIAVNGAPNVARGRASDQVLARWSNGPCARGDRTAK